MKSVLATCMNWLRRVVSRIVEQVPVQEEPRRDVTEMVNANNVWIETFLHTLVRQVMQERKVSFTQADLVMLATSVAGLLLARRVPAT